MTATPINKNFYRESDPDLWKGRVDSVNDPAEYRLHQMVRCMDAENIPENSEIVLLGFASDTGVRRNKGRTGSSEGPSYFRSSVGSLCWDHGTKPVADIGDIFPFEDQLEEAQNEMGYLIKALLKKGKKVCVIGGGHETAYGHYLGITGFLQEEQADPKLGIINIDAHFDLRSPIGGSNSGSSFYQAFQHAEDHDQDLAYFVYGINKDNNTPSLFKKAKELGTEYSTNREVIEHEADSIKKLNRFLESRSHVYLTICLDVFATHAAPGVSAPSWNGIEIRHALNVIKCIRESGKLISADICELNPAYDESGITARTAGTLFSELIR